MQLIIFDKLLQISETLNFSVRFNLTPRIDLVNQPDTVTYRLNQEPIMVELPRYETYPVKNSPLEFKIESQCDLVSIIEID